MKLRVLEADAPLEGLVLNLKETSENTYLCSLTGYIFIDSWDELNLIKKSKESSFYDMHVITDSIEGGNLCWIYEVEKIAEKQESILYKKKKEMMTKEEENVNYDNDKINWQIIEDDLGLLSRKMACMIAKREYDSKIKGKVTINLGGAIMEFRILGTKS